MNQFLNPWHELGVELPDTHSAADALERSGLAGWNLRKEPLHADVGRGKRVEVPGRYAVLRDLPGKRGADVLGVVGRAYRITQNEDLVGLLDAIVEESGARFEVAGSAEDGAVSFVTLRLPGRLRVGGRDDVESYISVLTTHDGSTSTQIIVTPVHIATQAALNLSYEGSPSVLRIRHTLGSSASLREQAEAALDFAYDYLEAFRREAEYLAAGTMSSLNFGKVVTREYGVPSTAPAGTQTRTENKLDRMVKEFDAVNDRSPWGALVALAVWSDRHSHVRGAGPEGERASRALKAIQDPWFKNSALKLLTRGG